MKLTDESIKKIVSELSNIVATLKPREQLIVIKLMRDNVVKCSKAFKKIAIENDKIEPYPHEHTKET